MIAAFFDADGTLYAAQMGRGLLRYARAHGRGGAAAAYYASLAPSLLLDKLGLSGPDSFHRAMIERLGWLIRGWDEAEGARAFQWVAEEYLLSTRRAAVVERLRAHQAQGHAVVIVSGMLAPCLERMGQALGVAHLIGTRVELRAGRYTGRIVPPIIKGSDKVSQLRAYLASRGMAIDWAGSWAYGDSFSDVDMLSLVGHPVAVRPDEKLRALAGEKRWEVLEAGAL